MKRYGCLIVAICMVLCCCGCSSQGSRTVFAMDTVMSLQIWGGNVEDSLDTLAQTILLMEKTWDPDRKGSVPYTLNHGGTAEGEELTRINELSERTGGAFDPTLGAVSDLWSFGKENKIPTREQIEGALKTEQWDFGAAIKGYTGDVLVQVMEELGVQRGILDLGGNIQTYGEKPDGSPWQIGIRDPDGGDPVGILSVTGTMAVVTSGDYQRYFEQDGKRYHHILDPETGYPADSGLQSVTVICRDGLTADCLSTALFVLGLEKGSELWRSSSDFEAVFITQDGQIFATEGAALSGCAYEVIEGEN